MSEVAALFASLPDHDLRVYLRDHLVFDQNCDPEAAPPLRLVSYYGRGWMADTGRPWLMLYMLEPGDATDCRDYEVPGASACSTEREAMELWCLYFWSFPAEPTP